MNIPSFTIRKFFLKKILKRMGNSCYIAMGVDIRGKVRNITIGNNVVVNPNTILDARGGSITIGNNVDIGQETNIWTLEHDPNDNNHGVKGGAVIIGDHVWISTRVTILPNVKLGRGAVIASNSVVTRDVPDSCIVAGIPAKIIGVRKNDLTYELKYRPWFL